MSRDYSSRRSSGPGRASDGRPNRQHSDSAKRNTRHQPPRKPASRSQRSQGGNTRHGTRSEQGPADNRRVWLICAVLIAIIALCLYFISQPASHEAKSTDIDLPKAHADEASSTDEADKSESEHTAKTSDKASPKSKQTEQTEDKANQQAADQEPRFSFYKMLPNYRVEVEEEHHTPTPVARAQTPHEPEVSSKTPVPGGSGKPKSASNQTPANQTSDQSSPGADGQFQFRIQVGAFSRAEDAQRRRQELSDLGVPAQVQSMQTDDGKTIYRVQSDRLDSRVQARSMSQKLENHGIETMIQRLAAEAG